MKTNIHLEVSKTNRDQMPLPILYNIHVNQWLTVISEKALIAWLKIYSWAVNEEIVISENNVEDFSSMTALARKLEIGSETLNEKVLKPLWNVGLIDIEQKTIRSSKVGERTITIKIYRYPQNKIEKSFMPLEIYRDYDMDYQSTLNHCSEKTTTIRDVIIKHNQRLKNDGVSEELIIDLFKYEEKLSNGLSEVQFSDMLDKTLTFAKEAIGSKGSAKGYFIAAIKSYKNKLKE